MQRLPYHLITMAGIAVDGDTHLLLRTSRVVYTADDNLHSMRIAGSKERWRDASAAPWSATRCARFGSCSVLPVGCPAPRWPGGASHARAVGSRVSALSPPDRARRTAEARRDGDRESVVDR